MVRDLMRQKFEKFAHLEGQMGRLPQMESAQVGLDQRLIAVERDVKDVSHKQDEYARHAAQREHAAQLGMVP